MTRNKHDYDDIIDLPHYQSKRHRHMTMKERAAQFAPFAALSGYEESINESNRITQEKIELGEDELINLDLKMQFVIASVGKTTQFTFVYFVPDELKSGGAYISISGSVKKFNNYNKTIILDDNTEIKINDIIKIQSDSFDKMGL